MASTFEPARLAHSVALALRLDRARFGLELNDEGWASFDDLVVAIRFERYDWTFLDEALVNATIPFTFRPV